MVDLVLTALKLVGAICFFLVPGLFASQILRLATARIQILPIAVGLSLIFITLLDLPLVCFHGNILWLLASWCILSAVLGYLALRKGVLRAIGSGVADWFNALKSGDLDAILVGVSYILLAVLCIYLFTGPGCMGGEEEMELIITRKFLENPYWTFDNAGHVPHLVPTYLLTPLYLFRAMLSMVTGIDPLILHFRLGFVPPLIAIVSLASIVHVLTNSARLAQSIVLLGALCALFAPLDILSFSPFILPGRSFGYELPAPSAFYRATFSIQVATPICILLMLLALTQVKRWWVYALLFFLMLFTTVQIHATAAIYLMELMGFCALAFILAAAGKKLSYITSNPGVRRSIMMLVASAALLFIYKQCFNAVHQDIESLDIHQRRYILQNLMACLHDPVRFFVQYPETIYRYDYFRYRGAIYDSLWYQLLDLSNPVMILSWLCAYVYLLFKRHFAPLFLLFVLVGFPALLRLPIFAVFALALNQAIFNDLSEHLTFFGYIAFFLASTVFAGLITGCLINARLVRNPWVVCCVVVAAGLTSFYLIGGAVFFLKGALVHKAGDKAFVIFYGGIVLGACLLASIRQRPLCWDFSQYQLFPTLLILIALALPVVLRQYHYDDIIVKQPYRHRTVTHSLSQQVSRLIKLKDPYAQSSQNIWYLSNLTKGLYDCLMFVRHDLPAQGIFAADPAVIRTIPLLANQYIVHTGVPYDFTEAYFNRYYKPTVRQDSLPIPDSKELPYVCNDPFFQHEQRLSERSLSEDAQFVKDFHVNYVLITPAFHEGTDKLFQALGTSKSLNTTKLYDRAGYSIYRIDGATPS